MWGQRRNVDFVSVFPFLLLLWSGEVCFGQNDILFASLRPVGTREVQVSFVPPVDGMYSIWYQQNVECNDFDVTSAMNVTVSANGSNSIQRNVPSTGPGQYVSVSVTSDNLTNYTFPTTCIQSFLNAPGMFSVDAFVTADGNMTVKLNGAFDGVVVCEVQYRLSNDQIENKISTRDPPASTINVTSLLNTVLYQVRARCGVDGSSGDVYGPYSSWQDVKAAPISGSLCNSNQPPAAASVMTITVLLFSAILAKCLTL